MTEGRETEAGERGAQPRGKVVRFPRDWLGPRDKLVPFGPRAASVDTDEPPPDPDESPPSAEDFWGERSAAIHGALQAPADPERLDDAAAVPGAIRVGVVGRRAVAAAAAGLAIAAVTVIALVSGSLGPGPAPQRAGGSKAGFAAVFSGGISSIVRLGLAQVDESRAHKPAARATASTVRRTRHRPPASKLHQNAARPRPAPSVRPAPPDVAATTPVTTASSRTYYPAVNTAPAIRSHPSSPASPPVASRATVSATGESGALGPIQSPNG